MAPATMRSVFPFAFLALAPLACSLFAKSPALSSPLKDKLAQAETTTVEDAAKACLTKEGWKPDSMGGFAEGANVVTARNAAKDRISVYVQPAEMTPRVTGGPAYDDPFWSCLGQELSGGAKAVPSGSLA